MKPLERTAWAVRRVGETVVYKRASRTTGPAPVVTYSDKSVPAAVMAFRINPMAGNSIQAGDRQCSIAAIDLPFEPTADDLIVIKAVPWRVINVAVFTVRGQVARYDLQLRR